MSGHGGTNKKDKIKDTAAVFLQLLKIDEDATLLEQQVQSLCITGMEKPSKVGFKRIQTAVVESLTVIKDRANTIDKKLGTVSGFDAGASRGAAKRIMEDHGNAHLYDERTTNVIPISPPITKTSKSTSVRVKRRAAAFAELSPGQRKKVLGEEDLPLPSPGKNFFSPKGYLKFINRIRTPSKAKARQNIISRNLLGIDGPTSENALRKIERKSKLLGFTVKTRWGKVGKQKTVQTQEFHDALVQYSKENPGQTMEEDAVRNILYDAKKKDAVEKGFAPIAIEGPSDKTVKMHMELAGTFKIALNIEKVKNKNQARRKKEASIRSAASYTIALSHHFEPCKKEEEPSWIDATDGAKRFRLLMCKYFKCDHVRPIMREMIFASDDKACFVTFDGKKSGRRKERKILIQDPDNPIDHSVRGVVSKNEENSFLAGQTMRLTVTMCPDSKFQMRIQMTCTIAKLY